MSQIAGEFLIETAPFLTGPANAASAADQSEPGSRILVVSPAGPGASEALDSLAAHFQVQKVEALDTAYVRLAGNPFHALVLRGDAAATFEELCSFLTYVSAAHPETPLVLLSPAANRELAAMALSMGIYNYLAEPFGPDELLISVANAIRGRSIERRDREYRRQADERVQDRTAQLWEAVSLLQEREDELRSSREETVKRLSIAAELRDDETPRHIQRMSSYCGLLAERLDLGEERCETIRLASQMHDVGKIGLPDDILSSTGKLTDEQRRIMQQHCEIGHRILAGSSSELLDTAAVIALTHHERFDGGGYPHGLARQEIPIEGRIAAIADVFDALTSGRPYREAYSFEQAMDMMRKEREGHFDPILLDFFLNSPHVLHDIKHRYADE